MINKKQKEIEQNAAFQRWKRDTYPYLILLVQMLFLCSGVVLSISAVLWGVYDDPIGKDITITSAGFLLGLSLGSIVGDSWLKLKWLNK